MRETLVYRPKHPKANKNGMVPRALAGQPARRDAPHVISDCIDDTWHPADGKTYDSKSNFRRATKARGMIEVGTERQADRRTIEPVSKREVIEAVHKLNAGYRPRPDSITYTGDGWN